MKMYRNLFAIAFLTLAASSVLAAQEPVLFDGTNPIVLGFQAASGPEAVPSDDAIPRAHLITPEELAQTLKSAKHKPLILSVGPHSMYLQAHIPGAEYMGAGSSDAGEQAIRERVKSLPKNSAIVIYCGCCPWGHCPNMHPAYQLLHSLGFTNVKAVYIASDFGTDWVNKGYPVAKGE
jgi:thiosulfate/3-mercaptopyruvate sulfurtransferase